MRRATLLAVAGFFAATLFCGCALPANDGRSESSAMTGTDDTSLGRAIAPRAAAHASLTGLHLLQASHGAFAARVLLARTAERSLDLQYYIWHDDLTGKLLFEELHKAADRGVRVRLLLDDNNTGGLDETLSALDAHPGIEVRLFNPFKFRSARWLGYLTDFSRLNRRMHNKSFTADSHATIIGGRNIGDEYFGVEGGTLFEDLDALAVGPAVRAVAQDFDRYWASPSAYPIGRIVSPVSAERLSVIKAEAANVERDPKAERYMNALRESTFARRIVDGRLPLIWASTRMVSDDPSKVLGKAPDEEMLLPKLQRALGKPKKTLDLVSPYFVPTDAGASAFAAMAARGVSIRVLTNALEATDVAPVHAGYAKHRKELLAAGIRLYELRRVSDQPRKSAASKVGLGGSSASSLHAKTFAVDSDRAFIGSFNLDPRSAKLNTELGFLIESPEIAQAIHGAFDAEVPARSYEVKLNGSSDLIWIERQGGQEITHETEPGAGPLMRLWIRFLSLLPIDWML